MKNWNWEFVQYLKHKLYVFGYNSLYCNLLYVSAYNIELILYFERFGKQLELNNKQIQSAFKRVEGWVPKALLLINKSFLPDDLKLEYIDVISTQAAKLEV